MFGLTHRSWAPKLGHLELRVMAVAWAHPGVLTAREFIDAFDDQTIALSTMQTTLERLTKKGLLVREKHSRAFAYRAEVARDDLISRVMRDISNEFATGRIEPLLAGFLNLVDELDPEHSEAILAEIEKRARKR